MISCSSRRNSSDFTNFLEISRDLSRWKAESKVNQGQGGRNMTKQSVEIKVGSFLVFARPVAVHDVPLKRLWLKNHPKVTSMRLDSKDSCLEDATQKLKGEVITVDIRRLHNAGRATMNTCNQCGCSCELWAKHSYHCNIQRWLSRPFQFRSVSPVESAEGQADFKDSKTFPNTKCYGIFARLQCS